MQTANQGQCRQVQNAHVIGSLLSAHKVVEQLVKLGLTVLSVSVEGARPVIEVQNGCRCEVLKGVPYIYRHGIYGPERVMTATVQGCKVVWIVRAC